MSVTISVDTQALDALLKEIGDDIDAAARPAAQAGAQVLYDEVKRNVAALGTVKGNLAASIYQVYSRSNSGVDHATYYVSWNERKAPHGGLVEFGHIQRYVSFIGKDGKWHTAVRKAMQGKPRPGRRAAPSVKDAYYVPLPAPKQIAARSFLRKAQVKFPQALDAAAAELMKRINRVS